MNIRAKSEPGVEDWWQRLLIKLLIRSTFSRWALSLNLSSLSFENKGLEWPFLDWKVIILIAFFVM